MSIPSVKYDPHLNSIPTDLVNVIIGFLEDGEKYPLKFLNKRFNQLNTLKNLKLYATDDAYQPGIKVDSKVYCLWIKSQKFPLFTTVMNLTVREGKLGLAKWLREEGGAWNHWTTVDRHGHLEILKWLIANKCPFDDGECLGRAEDNNIRKWIVQNTQEKSNISFDYISTGIHKIIIEFLTPQESFPLVFVNKQFYHYGHRSIDLSPGSAYKPGIENGSLTYCRWIKSLKFPLIATVFNESVQRGDKNILTWLRENGYTFDEPRRVQGKRKFLD